MLCLTRTYLDCVGFAHSDWLESILRETENAKTRTRFDYRPLKRMVEML
jgi:hypothetical protein